MVSDCANIVVHAPATLSASSHFYPTPRNKMIETLTRWSMVWQERPEPFGAPRSRSTNIFRCMMPKRDMCASADRNGMLVVDGGWGRPKAEAFKPPELAGYFGLCTMQRRSALWRELAKQQQQQYRDRDIGNAYAIPAGCEWNMPVCTQHTATFETKDRKK